MNVKTAPYGSWISPITSESVVAGTRRFADTAIDGADIYWIESRPVDKGRNVLVRYAADGNRHDLTPSPYNVRSRVHEYGGGSFSVFQGVAYFVNWTDQRIYWIATDGTITPLTVEAPCSYADFAFDPRRNRLIAVRECQFEVEREPINDIVAISLSGGDATQHGISLIHGSDFVAHPRISPDGHQFCWLQWNHPEMPWDGCTLWLGDVAQSGEIINRRVIAGGVQESIAQPEWTPNGTLIFASDRTGWWNLYQWHEEITTPLLESASEYAEPLWTFGQPLYAVISHDELIAAVTLNGTWSLQRINLADGMVSPVSIPSTDIAVVRANQQFAFFHAGSPVEPTTLVRLNLQTNKTAVIARSSSSEPERGYISAPGAITWPTGNGEVAHGFYYPPQNQDFVGPDGHLPPLIVISHGGPTSATNTTLNTRLQYWTSRGFSILDVNYRGSSGYGRPYRERLNGNWGIADVDDCVNGARYLVTEGLVDPDRLIIRGSSASGYTTLAALTFSDQFQIGVSYYGISDLEAIASDTHKFESHYLDRLIGPLPEFAQTYHDRSPIHHIDQLQCSLLLFQGLEDKVVPPSQAERMYEAVRDKGLPVAYIAFPGEQHGFRQSQNIRRTLDAELDFHSRVLGFTLPESVEPVEIANL